MNLHNMNLHQQLKFTARGFLSGAKPSPMLVGAAALGLTVALNGISSAVTDDLARGKVMTNALNEYAISADFDQLMTAVQSVQLSFSQIFLSTLLSLMVLMVSVGIIIYVMTEVRYHKGAFGNLLDGLPVLMRVVWYQIVTTVYVFLWSLLLVVPGVIASYRYRQGLYILLDHPEMSVRQCIRASKHMMEGQKWDLFLLDVSFLGWTIGESLLAMSLAYLFGGTGLLANLMILPISAFIRMYMEFTQFLYYEHLCGNHYDSRIFNVTPSGN